MKNSPQQWLKYLSENCALSTERWTEAPDEYLRAARHAIENGLPSKIACDPEGNFYVLGKYPNTEEIIVVKVK